MPRNYIDTPGTERGDVSLAHVPSLDFSIVQPFASPSKNPAEDLRNKMRGLRGDTFRQPPMRTPRLHNALVNKPNPAGPSQQEFTPLLRSAKRKELLRRSVMGNKENAILPDIPPTPAGFRSSYGDATQLPMNSSMLDENTTSSIGAGHAITHPVSSSMLSATPMPAMPRDGQVVLEQGNVLSLRDQEAKLDQIQKENFGLKLKIHFLEEALRKTGSEYHQATLKENAELKTERVTIDAESKRQRKRYLALEQELEEYRQRFSHEAQGTMQNNDVQHVEELAKLRAVAEESQRLAEQRLRDMEDLQSRLEEAQKEDVQSNELQDLKEDLEDMQRELRDRDNQLESKAEELANLQTELQASKSGSTEMQHLQEDIDDLEAELNVKEDELDAKNDRILALEQKLLGSQREDAVEAGLRSELKQFEDELKHKTESIDNAVQQIAQLKEHLRSVEAANKQEIDAREEDLDVLQAKFENIQLDHASSSKQKDDALKNVERELADKDGEIRALQERLNTARGSWDAEAQQTDARLHEKNRQVKDKEAQLREKDRVIEVRDEELADLQRRLRTAESRQADAAQSQSNKLSSMAEQIAALQSEVRLKDAQVKDSLSSNEKVTESRTSELRSLRAKVHALPSHDEIKVKNERIHELETSNRHLESTAREAARKISTLVRQAQSVETPSRKDAILKEQSAKIELLQEQTQTKEAELTELEREIELLEKENIGLQQQAGRVGDLQSRFDALIDEKESLARKVERLQEKSKSAEKDHSILGHQSDELSEKQARIETLEDEIDKLENACKRHTRQMHIDIEALRQDHDRHLAETKQGLEDEIAMLEAALDEADEAGNAAARRLTELETALREAKAVKETSTPARERNGLRLKATLLESEREALKMQLAEYERASKQRAEQIDDLNARIVALEADLAVAQAEKTIADERQDLHEIVKRSRIEVEELQLKLNKAQEAIKFDGSDTGLRGQLEVTQTEIEAYQAHVSELEQRLSHQAAREKQLRAQLRQSKESVLQRADLEMQLDDRKDSSNGHARREAELRNQLRDAKIGIESMQQELAEKEDRILALMKREQALRHKLKHTNQGDETQILVEDLQAQLEDAEADIAALQQQLVGREKKLGVAHKKETELRIKINQLRKSARIENDDEARQQQRQHRLELKGLTKQIRLLRERCGREESFRKDLIYSKRWFLMQVEMYNECNQADLRLLEDMGITPNQNIRQRSPSLRTVGLTVLATIRMQRRAAIWADNKKQQKQLVEQLGVLKTGTAR